MKRLKMFYLTPIIALGLFIMSSCSNNSAKSEDLEISTMDSVSKDLEKTTKELEEKNAKLEASLEKLDKEFETAK
jgi:septal ring factor EnvC (AmiA/AmiB activator)